MSESTRDVSTHTALQDQKFNYVFHWFDQDGDGWLTQTDIETMSALFDALALESDHKSKSLIHTGFMNWWQLLRDGREDKTSEKISKQEFIRIMYAVVLAPKNFEIAVASVVDGMLGALDRDGNGKLSQDEYFGLNSALNLTRDTAIEAFKRLDRDGDGEISRTEFQQALFEYYLSADPDAPGNWLLGPMDLST